MFTEQISLQMFRTITRIRVSPQYEIRIMMFPIKYIQKEKIKAALYITPQMIKTWNYFPVDQIIDSTYFVINKRSPIKWRFFIILCAYSIGVSEVVYSFLTKDETIETINSVFSYLKSLKKYTPKLRRKYSLINS